MGSVLIVDDEPIVRSMLERLLEETGHAVRTAVDAESALKTIAEAPPDVVFCDVHLPGASGLWLIDRLRSAAPGCAVIIMSGDATVPPHETLRGGVVAYVLKPFVPRKILRALEEGMRWSANARSQPPARVTRRLLSA